jgi:hypothetical protein
MEAKDQHHAVVALTLGKQPLVSVTYKAGSNEINPAPYRN